MKVGAIIQARTSSTRLPRKVLKELPYNSGTTVLEQVIRRVSRASCLNELIVATTNETEDDEIFALTERAGVKAFRGSKEDVLSRYYHAAKKNELDVILRITSDCPCVDWEIIDTVAKEIIEKNKDFAHVKESYPRGVGDVEAFTFAALKEAFLKAEEKHDREHVCPYIYRTKPGSFNISQIEAPEEFRRPDIRVTLDTIEDYAVLCEVFDELCRVNPFFSVKEIVGLFVDKPWLKMINGKVVQKTLNDLNGEIEEALKLLEIQDLKRARNFLKEQWKS